MYPPTYHFPMMHLLHPGLRCTWHQKGWKAREYFHSSLDLAQTYCIHLFHCEMSLFTFCLPYSYISQTMEAIFQFFCFFFSLFYGKLIHLCCTLLCIGWSYFHINICISLHCQINFVFISTLLTISILVGVKILNWKLINPPPTSHLPNWNTGFHRFVNSTKTQTIISEN